jgi:hypothetical protein
MYRNRESFGPSFAEALSSLCTAGIAGIKARIMTRTKALKEQCRWADTVVYHIAAQSILTSSEGVWR